MNFAKLRFAVFTRMRLYQNTVFTRNFYRVISRICVYLLLIIVILLLLVLFMSLFYLAQNEDGEINLFKSSSDLSETASTEGNTVKTNWTALADSMTKLTENLYGKNGFKSSSFVKVRERCGKRADSDFSEAFLDDYYFPIEPNICRGKVFLLIGIITSPEYFRARTTIRDTWASHRVYAGKPVEFVFVVPLSASDKVQDQVKEEAISYHDILQIDVQADNKFAARKCLSGFFYWTTTKCPQTSYIFKTDEILFIDVIHSVQFLDAARPAYFSCNTQRIKVNNKRRSLKDYVPRSVYRRTKYPLSCMGYGYFVNSMIIKDLLMCDLLLMDNRMHLADVYFSGILANRLSFPREPFWKTHTWTYFKPSLGGKGAADFMFMRSAQPDIAMLYWKKVWYEMLVMYNT